MNSGADLSSLEELQIWHNSLSTVRLEALEALSSVYIEIRRAWDWLDQQQTFWKAQLRDIEEEVIQAKAELARRKYPDFAGRILDCSIQEEILRQAVGRKHFIEDRLDAIRSWNTRLPKLINETYENKGQALGNFLEGETLRSLNLIASQIRTLESYLAMTPAPTVPIPTEKPK